MLKYPHDRHNGYVLLIDGSGNAYMPDWDLERTCESRGSVVGDAMKYAGAFLVLANRYTKHKEGSNAK